VSSSILPHELYIRIVTGRARYGNIVEEISRASFQEVGTGPCGLHIPEILYCRVSYVSEGFLRQIGLVTTARYLLMDVLCEKNSNSRHEDVVEG
jgi:hypothetical protein